MSWHRCVTAGWLAIYTLLACDGESADPGVAAGTSGGPNDGAQDGSGGWSAAGSSSVNRAINRGGCPATNSAMVLLPEGYCIDSMEVTRGQYQAWLATGPSVDGQDQGCASNTSFALDEVCMTDPQVYRGSDSDLHPVVCIDWCDAYAYCQAVGKRLCGKIGGGMNSVVDYTKANLSQWYNACVSGTVNNVFPYGEFFDPFACNGFGRTNAPESDTTMPVGTLAQCQSPVAGYEGVHDLSGNAWEWEDSCDEGWDACYIRGGAFVSDFTDLPCAGGYALTRTSPRRSVGFRCCAP